MDSEGRILALRSGTADVVVTSADGASATCPVTVENGLATAFTTADAYADVHAFWQGDVLTLTAATSAHAVLYDMYGHALQSWQIPAAGTHTCTFAAMPKGIYLLRVGNRTLKRVK